MNALKDGKNKCATLSQKAAAFSALEPKDYSKLLMIASYTAWRFHGKVNHADEEDLLQEAFLRALDVENIRKWYPEKVPFVVFLAGCIRSIAWDWKMKARTTYLANEPLSTRRHDVEVEARITFMEIRKVLKERPDAWEIFWLKCEGATAKQIQKTLNLDRHVYDAAVKWIHRTLRREGFRL